MFIRSVDVGGYRNASTRIARAAHKKLLLEGGRNGRYHRAQMMKKKDQMRSKSIIGELTSINYMVRDMITKSREDTERWRAENRYPESIMDGSRGCSSMEMGDLAHQGGPRRRRIMFAIDQYRDRGSVEIAPVQRYRIMTSETRQMTIERRRRRRNNVTSQSNDTRRIKRGRCRGMQFVDISKNRPWYSDQVRNSGQIAPDQEHEEGTSPMTFRRCLAHRDLDVREPDDEGDIELNGIDN